MPILTLDDPRFDDIATDYYGDIAGLSRRAVAGDLTQAEYRRQHYEITAAVLAALFSEAGADMSNPTAAAFLQEQIEIADVSAAMLAFDVANGRYSASDIQSASRGMEKLLTRLELWTYSAGGVYQRGIISGLPVDGRERIFAWDLGATEKHCATCLEMSGLTFVQSVWQDFAAGGIYPQGHGLACKGFRCDCRYREVNGR